MFTYGCILSILSAFKKPAGVPSAVPTIIISDYLNEVTKILPMVQMLAGRLADALKVSEAVPPALTETYSTMFVSKCNKTYTW